jgi:hypothetical protein
MALLGIALALPVLVNSISGAWTTLFEFMVF